MVKLYSYDVFDTVFTRRTATPKGIFSLIQNQLKSMAMGVPTELKENFFELRVQGERFARRFYVKNDNEEITLKQIYQAMNSTGILTDEMIDRLMKLECEVEAENIVPIYPIVDEIKGRLDKGESVVFISDMYLDKQVISEFLGAVDDRLKEIPLYVSSDIGKTKHSGNLFRYIQKEQGIAYEDWIHIGDNENSDITIPRSLGIKTIQVPEKGLIPIEKHMLLQCERSSSLQMLVGISKNARTLYGLNKIEETGASLAGFLLGSYVKWILQDALKRGTKTLFFIARDGYVLKELADIFIQCMGYKIDTKYLYGSRHAWRMPELDWRNVDFNGLINVSLPDFLNDLEAVANVFGISLSELLPFLPDNIDRNIENLSNIDVKIIFSYLNDSRKFREYLMDIYAKKQKLVLAYLKQEIDASEKRVSFVEVGGTGFTQKCMERILRNFYEGEVSTYFFELYYANEKESYTFYNFVPDDLYMKDAIEPLCRAPHGQCLGYREAGGHIEPVLEECRHMSFYENEYKDYIEGIRAYANIYMKYYKDIFELPVDRGLIERCWDYYTKAGDNDILDFVGEIPFEVTGKEYDASKYAPKLGQQEIQDIFFTYREEPLAWHYQGACLDMSILRMNRQEKELMNHYKKKKNEANKLSKAESNNDTFVRIPRHKYPVKAKIALYGAGKIGTDFYNQIQQEKEYELVLWVDRQYEKYKNKGYPVSSPDDVKRKEFDIILIAVLNANVQKEIRAGLISLGVRLEQIQYISSEEFLKGYRYGE